MSVVSSSKTQTAGSHTWGSGLSDSARGPPSMRRRRTKLATDKKIADDEFMAAAIGDVEWLKQSLKDTGPELNFDKNGLTAIHLAAIHGRIECLKLCIEKFKIDIDLPSSTGWRPVHLCISNQTGKRALHCLSYLLEKGANCSLTNDDGITPVHQAASEGHAQCLKILLEVGARIDGQDCRGNTPLDLAKLWGHRKCARILAAEMWHQGKDSVAQEMQQLKKVKMQQVLNELETEEEMKAAQQFYGNQAFNNWMANKDLKGTPRSMDKKYKGKQMDNSGLMKPNSVARQNVDTKISDTPKTKISMDARIRTEKVKKGETKDTADDLENDAELLKNLCGDTDDSASKDAKKGKVELKLVQHPKDWNKSTFTKASPYLPNLGDDFPRDEYTMMATVKGTPKFYEGKFVRPLTPSDIDEDVKEKGSLSKLRKPRLPEEVINKVLSKDPSISDRGIIFKCRHIGDVHTKKKYDVEQKGRPQAPLHLGDDVKSYLVQASLHKGGLKPLPSSKAPSTNSHGSHSEWMTDTFPLPMVMNTLKQMSKPRHFPNTYGNEYILNFGDIK